jgi:hypothetical protein
MKSRPPLTIRRAAVSAALIAAGAIFFPIALVVEPALSGLFGLCIVAMCALPMAGVSVLFRRSWIDPCVVFAIAAGVGMAFFFAVIS